MIGVLNVMEYQVIVIRSVTSIITLFLLSKLMGRKQVSQLSMFDYVVGISIGSIAAAMTVDTEIKWYYFVTAMGIYAGIYILIAMASIKSLWARKFFEGAPIILIQDGKIICKNVKKVRYDINSLLEECRFAGYFDVSDINIAIMESNGKVSILPKLNKRMVTIGDLQLAVKPDGLVANVVIDGCIMTGNLKAIGKDEKWLLKEIKKQNVESLKEILLATCDVNDTCNLFLKNEDINVKHCLE